MRRIFTWFSSLFQTVVAWILPAWEQRGAVKSGTGGRVLRRILHVLVVVVIVLLLFYLNYRLRLENWIPRAPYLRKSWLPILFLLLYLLGWLVVLLIRVLSGRETARTFPDIDRAWIEAMEALERAHLRLIDLPLFLVLGQPEDNERNLFQDVQLVVPQTPSRADAPLHVFASRDGIWITCPGASLLGLHAAVLARKISLTADQGGAAAGAAEQPDVDDTEEAMKTLSPTRAGAVVSNIKDIRLRADLENRELTDFERRQIRSLIRRDDPRNSVLNHPELVAEQAERLRYLCRLITQGRTPYCPINGLLMLVPFSGTDHIQDATDTGNICRYDLAVTRSALRVHCPLIVLVCDVDVAPGFPEFIERFSDRERKSRIGQRCPLVPEFRRGAVSANGHGNPVSDMVDSLSRWICHSVVPGWVYRKFELENENDPASFDVTVQRNANLHLFANEMSERSGALSTILTTGLAEEAPDPPLIGGCYIAGTGRDASRQQAFTAGVLYRMIDEQNCVQWTPETKAEEEWLNRLTTLGWGVLTAVVLTLLAVLVLSLLG
jgi:IcmF-related N-terminal domain